MTIECDGDIPFAVVNSIKEIREVVGVRRVPKLD